MERLPSGLVIDLGPQPEHHLDPLGSDQYRTHVARVTPPGVPYASFPVYNGTSKCLPLLDVMLNVTIEGPIVSSRLVQKFSNFTDQPILETLYTFPLYDGSAVISFRCWIGNDRVLEGIVKPKEVAQQEFKQAMKQQKVAALLEEHTPEIFETKVGNIPPQTTVKVEIVYISQAKADLTTGGILVTIPSSIAPRYGSPSNLAFQPASGTASVSENGLKIDIHVSMPAPIKKIESRTHAVSVEIGAEIHNSFKKLAAGASASNFDPSKARVSLSDHEKVLGKDLVLQLSLQGHDSLSSRAVIEHQPGIPNRAAMMLTITPQDLFKGHFSPDTFKGEIIFLVDRSGSMLDKVQALRNALRVFLRSLPIGCLFNICSFGWSHSLLWPNSQEYNQETMSLANNFVESLDANMGGTELLPALEATVRQRWEGPENTTEIIVLTDGEVWNTEETINYVRATRTGTAERVRFFALGIGDQVSHRLVEGIGQQGGGFSEVVAVDAAGAWQERVIRMLKGALTPHRWQCQLKFGNEVLPPLPTATMSDLATLRPPCIQAPYKIPALHPFNQFSIFLFINTEGYVLPRSITVEGTILPKGESVTAELPIDEMAGERPSVHYLAAKALMNDLETGQSWLHSKQYDEYQNNYSSQFQSAVQTQAQNLGQQWSITGKWTSFIAVDKTSQKRNEISLYKAQLVESSGLMKPRNPYGLSNNISSPAAPTMSFGGAAPSVSYQQSISPASTYQTQSGGTYHGSPHPPPPAAPHNESGEIFMTKDRQDGYQFIRDTRRGGSRNCAFGGPGELSGFGPHLSKPLRSSYPQDMDYARKDDALYAVLNTANFKHNVALHGQGAKHPRTPPNEFARESWGTRGDRSSNESHKAPPAHRLDYEPATSPSQAPPVLTDEQQHRRQQPPSVFPNPFSFSHSPASGIFSAPYGGSSSQRSAPVPTIPPGDEKCSLTDIISMQTAIGGFELKGLLNITKHILLSAFEPDVLQKMAEKFLNVDVAHLDASSLLPLAPASLSGYASSLESERNIIIQPATAATADASEPHQTSTRVTIQPALFDTILAITYIQSQYPESSGLWELVVRKARAWFAIVFRGMVSRCDTELFASQPEWVKDRELVAETLEEVARGRLKGVGVDGDEDEKEGEQDGNESCEQEGGDDLDVQMYPESIDNGISDESG
ncbi:hypothetical protein FQN55_005116 [Onygenales sp. PD_40]|nr:hypothetical protein FQN55_005116 [Onygenales sp. PD_40]